MKTLHEIKDEIAKSHGYKSFYEMQFPYDMVCEDDINLIAKHYAEEALKEAAKRATVKTEKMLKFPDSKLKSTKNIFMVDKNSILSLIDEL